MWDLGVGDLAVWDLDVGDLGVWDLGFGDLGVCNLCNLSDRAFMLAKLQGILMSLVRHQDSLQC